MSQVILKGGTPLRPQGANLPLHDKQLKKGEKKKKTKVCKPFPFLLETEVSCRRHTMRTEIYPFKIRLSDLLNGNVD